MKIFCYGSLKKGGLFHYILGNSKYIEDGRLSGYSLYTSGKLPMIKEELGGKVYGEVYEVSDEIIQAVRKLESMYNEVLVHVMVEGEPVACLAYVYSDRLRHYRWRLVRDGKYKI